MTRPITRMILHCSDSLWGNAEAIDEWHKERGWSGIGYHFVVLNAYPEHGNLKDRKPYPWLDGRIETGRPIEIAGAHTYGYNSDSIGVCMIGIDTFTQRQLRSVVFIYDKFKKLYPSLTLFGHRELLTNRTKKTCPNIDMDLMRKFIVLPAMLTCEPDAVRALREG